MMVPAGSHHGRAHRGIRARRRVAARESRARGARSGDRHEDRFLGGCGARCRLPGTPHVIIDVAVTAATLAAALLFGVPIITTIAARATIGTLALGRERPTRRETPWAEGCIRSRSCASFLGARSPRCALLPPRLHVDVVVPGIATDAQVVRAIAIGRISTSPNGLYRAW